MHFRGRCRIAATVILTALLFSFSLQSFAFAEETQVEGTQEVASSDESFDSVGDIPLDASYEELVNYGKAHEDELEDPHHMWNSPEAGISVQSSSPTWKTVNGVKTFVDGRGETFASPALKVLDVSSWQGEIDWQAVKNSDVDAVILRAGYGIGNLDDTFAYNVQQVKRYGIPYGIYLYSYAYDASFASREAAWVAEIIQKYNCQDMSLPVYFDLENWGSWKENGITRYVPTKPSEYEKIVDAFTNTLASRGVTNVHVYTYRAYLQSALDSPDIWAITSWIAEYNPTLAIDNTYYAGQYGWQYTSSGRVPGVAGGVDLSAFSDWDYRNVTHLSAVDIPDGTYYLNAQICDSSGITIKDDSTASGATPVLRGAGGSGSQRFVFTRQDDGSYVITNEASGLALDVYGANAYAGAKVQQYTANGSDAQRWFIRDSGSGFYIQSALGNWVLDISGASTVDNTLVRLYAPNGTTAQLFMAAAADVTPPEGNAFSIQTALGSNMALDVKSGSKSNNAAVQLYTWNETDAQLFSLVSAGNGIYSIINVNSGKALEVSAGKTANGSKVAQYESNGSLSQHWTLRDAGNGAFYLLNCKTGKALDIPSGKASNGVQLQIYTANGTNAQKWTLSEHTTMRERIDAFASEHSGTITEGTYAIASFGAERQVIDVASGSSANSANVQLYASNGTNAQRWSIAEDESGYLTITNVNSGKVLDVYGASTANATNVQQYASNGSYAQKWIAVKNDDGTITFHSALAENLVLDAKGGKTANGTNIDVYASNGTAAQKYHLYSADAPSTSGRALEDGTYTITAGDGRVLDVPGAKTSDGVQLQVYTSNGSAAQLFYLDYNEANGFYSIKSIASGRMLDVSKGDFVPATPVNQWGTSAGATAQRYWRLDDNGDGSYYIVSAATGLVLGCSSSGQLITVPMGDARAVIWSFDCSDVPWTQEELDKIASSQGVVLGDGVYTVASAANGSMVLDVNGASKQNGGNVQLYTSNGTSAQSWRIVNTSEGYVRIENVGSSRVLDVASGSAKAGTNVQQYEWNASRAQLWLPVQQENGSYVLYSALGHGLVLDVKSGSMKNGANIQVYTNNGTAAQKFTFE